MSPLRIGAIALVLVGLNACGGGDDDQSASTASAPPASTTTTAAKAACGPLEYGGTGNPAGVIVSDLPMRGDSAERSRQQVEAIRLVLADRKWRAGKTAVGLRVCDDTLEKTGLWDAALCRANANSYVADRKVLAVVGTYNSGCAAEEVPILNRGGVVMISPGNTAVCLTERSSSCADGQPESLYPSGKRTYARVVPNDSFQGAALAELAKRQGVKRPYVLYATDDPTSTGQARSFRGAARLLGMDIAGYRSWDPEAKDYRDLFAAVKQADADGVVLAGLIEQNGAQIIRDKVAVVGANDDVPLIAFDGFAQQSAIDGAGKAAQGMLASTPGQAPASLTGKGKTLVERLKKDLKGKSLEQFAPYAGEGAAIALDAIGRAGLDRPAVAAAVLSTRGGGGYLARYDIRPTGDPSVGPITILRAAKSFEQVSEVRPPARLVAAARG